MHNTYEVTLCRGHHFVEKMALSMWCDLTRTISNRPSLKPPISELATQGQPSEGCEIFTTSYMAVRSASLQQLPYNCVQMNMKSKAAPEHHMEQRLSLEPNDNKNGLGSKFG